jgi:hypothetical protein
MSNYPYAYYAEDPGAYMHGMIHGLGFILHEGLGTEQDTQGEGYCISKRKAQAIVPFHLAKGATRLPRPTSSMMLPHLH